MRSSAVTLCLLGTMAVVPVHLARGQDNAQQAPEANLRKSREELERIRQERDALQRKQEKLKSSAHSISDEVQNLDRQHDATKRAVHTLNQQLEYITGAVQQTTASLVRTEDEAAIKRAVLHRRLVDIYKRGAMYDLQALLSAESFGELVARYKYLHELALRDRALVRRMEDLQTTIRSKRKQLVTLQGAVQENRSEKQQEEERLRALEHQQQQNLARVQHEQQKTSRRIKELARAEARVTNIVATLERARRSRSSRSSTISRGASSIRTSDYGRLDWPVDGNILYSFGRAMNPNNTVTRWNGIGITAAPGTPVRAVASGEVRVAEPLGSYGRTVILEHGGGDYSVYGSLGSIAVHQGERIAKGQVIGTVGISDPEMPPHLHFEIRHGDGPAIDPTTWLRHTE